jgi:MFS family permease
MLVVFTIQSGFHGFTGALPVALAESGVDSTGIGIVVGSSSLCLIVAAPIAGILLDRVGSIRMLLLGGACYIAGAIILAVSPVSAEAPIWPWLVARGLQGIGFAVVVPSALTLVPLVVPDLRRGFWLTFTLLSQNLTVALMPAISLAVLRASSLAGVAVMVAAMAAIGTLLVRTLPRPGDGAGGATHPTAARRFGLAYRASWTAPLAVALLGVCYWGLVLAHLPPRAEAAGTGAELFFLGYGASVIATRLPAGWLSDRCPARPLVLAGLLTSVVSMMLLMAVPTVELLVAAGALSGTAAGLLMSPLLLELSRRSSNADRGSAFAMFAVATGAANAIGSIGGAPIIEALGFSAALVAGMVAVVVAGLVVVASPSFSRTGRPS